MSNPVIRDVVLFFEDEAESLIHALNIAADTNERSVAELGYAYEDSAVVRALTESAASWRRKAAKISTLYERIADSDLEYAEQIGRGY